MKQSKHEKDNGCRKLNEPLTCCQKCCHSVVKSVVTLLSSTYNALFPELQIILKFERNRINIKNKLVRIIVMQVSKLYPLPE